MAHRNHVCPIGSGPTCLLWGRPRSVRLGVRAEDDPELIDPFGGAADLAGLVLRTPRSPTESFDDDPLRMSFCEYDSKF